MPMPSTKILESEVGLFLNLLTVTVETGLDLRQSINCLKQSSYVSCPYLIEKFFSVLKLAGADDVGFDLALVAASEKKENPVIANMMYSLAQSPTNTRDLLLHLEAQRSFASAREQTRCEKLGRNYARRWLPHLCFFIFFVLPILLCPLIGPAFQTTALAADFTPLRMQSGP